LLIIVISGDDVGGADMYLNAAINLGVKIILKKPIVSVDLATAVTSCLSGAAD
jgi:hypothetical protein